MARASRCAGRIVPIRAGSNGKLEEDEMKKIVLGALFALGLGLAGMSGASAAAIGGINNGATNYSPIVQAAYGCRRVTICRRGEYGHRHCHVERVCHRW
jgi:hypothetical protein